MSLRFFSTVNASIETGQKSQRQTSWLCTREAEELNQALTGTAPAGGQSSA